MKKNSPSQSAFLGTRILLSVVVFLTGAFLALVGFGQNRLSEDSKQKITKETRVLIQSGQRFSLASFPSVNAQGPSAGLTDSPDGRTLIPAATPAMTFTVTSTADDAPSPPPVCGSNCTLRDAEAASNANPPPMGATNLIAFNIPSSDPGCDPITHVCTIALTDCLGRSGNFCFGFSQPVIIDGYTQPGSSPNTNPPGQGDNALIKVKIIGDSAADRVIQFCSGTACGLPGDSSGSTVKGLCLAGNPNNPLVFVGSNNDVVSGDFIGVDTDGTTVVSNGTPIQVAGNGSASGSVIGGTSPGLRNVIASNGGFALILNDGSNTVVQGNYIGTNAAGTAAIGSLGVAIDAEIGTGVTIGGTASGAGNVINGTDTGITIGGVQHNAQVNTTVQGNLIGMDATGTVAFHALAFGIRINQSLNNTIGGSTAGAGNVINARADGILVGGTPTDAVIQGNKIGTDITGTLPLGNGSCGIAALDTTTGTIGGVNPGEGNIIAFNGFNGISIFGSTGDQTAWTILGNSIHDNGLLGITLAASGCGSNAPTPNDHCDSPSGGNDQQNYPVITSAMFSGGSVTLSGTLDSVPNTAFRIEFFSGASCDPSNFGEGGHFLGSTNVTTSACPADPSQSNASFGPLMFTLPGGDTVVTATATRMASLAGCVSPPSGLVAWYPGDGNANDIVGINNGTLQGNATFGAGMVGQAFSFNANGYVQAPFSQNLDPANAITVDAWVNPSLQQGPASIVNHRPVANNTGYTLEQRFTQDGTVLWHIFVSGTSLDVVSNTTLPLSTWTHVAGTFDGTTSRLYFNGAEVGNAAGSGTIDASPGADLEIGRNIADGQLFAGLIDEVEIANRALSHSEIQAIFNAGSAGKCKFIETSEFSQCAGVAGAPTPTPTPTATPTPTPTPTPISSPTPTPTFTPTPTPIPSPTPTPTFTPTPTPLPSPTPTPTPTATPAVQATGFVIGDRDAVIGQHVTFWGGQWANLNSLSGGPAPASFKGFASNPVPNPATCGGAWTSTSGGSSNPPQTLPSYINVIAASSITKSGQVIKGNVVDIVTVQVDPGYAPDPAHPGTGTVMAIVCPANPGFPTPTPTPTPRKRHPRP